MMGSRRSFHLQSSVLRQLKALFSPNHLLKPTSPSAAIYQVRNPNIESDIPKALCSEQRLEPSWTRVFTERRRSKLQTLKSQTLKLCIHLQFDGLDKHFGGPGFTICLHCLIQPPFFFSFFSFFLGLAPSCQYFCLFAICCEFI